MSVNTFPLQVFDFGVSLSVIMRSPFSSIRTIYDPLNNKKILKIHFENMHAYKNNFLLTEIYKSILHILRF